MDKIPEMDPDTKFTCPLCDEEFHPNEKELLRLHMRAVHFQQMIAYHRLSTRPKPRKVNFCYALGCNETTENKHLTFFQLPRRPRALVWLINAGRYDMLNTPVELYVHHKICSRHFEVSVCADTLKTKLLAKAVPTIFTHSLEMMYESPASQGDALTRHSNSLIHQFHDKIIFERGSWTKKFNITIVPVDESYNPHEIKSRPHTKIFKAGNKALIYTLLQGQDRYSISDSAFRNYFKYRYKNKVQREDASANSKGNEGLSEFFEDNSGHENYQIYSLEDIDPQLHRDDCGPNPQITEEIVTNNKETELPEITVNNTVLCNETTMPDSEVMDISSGIGVMDESVWEHDYSLDRFRNMNRLCRLCTKELQNSDEKPVRDVLQSLHPLLQKCMNLSQDFKEDDCVPEKFCSSCVEKLQICDSVFQQIAETNVKLKKYLRLTQKNVGSNDTSKTATFGAEKLKEDLPTSLFGAEATNVTLDEPSEEPGESYVCDECPNSKIYKTLMVLRCHKVLVHEIDQNINEGRRKSYACKYCRRKFKFLKEFYHHQCKYKKRADRSEHPPVQRILKTVYTRRYKRHADGYMCCRCDYITSNESDIKTHWRSHIPSLPPRKQRQNRKKEPKYGCHICGRRFVSEASLNRHIEMHPNWRCNTCGKLFKSHMLLWTHKRRHEPDFPSLCHLCGKMYANILQHMNNAHNTVSKPRPSMCHICGKVLANTRCLKRHVYRVHELVNKNIVCPHCQKTSRDEFALKRHIKIVHATPKGFRCSLCDMSYKRVVSLRKHIREEHPHCEMCEKRFVTKEAKTIHEDLEHKEDNDCEQSFISKDGKELGQEIVYFWGDLQPLSANVETVITTGN